VTSALPSRQTPSIVDSSFTSAAVVVATMSYPGAAYGRDEPYLVPDIVKQFVVYLYNHIRCAFDSMVVLA
jgi:hypothetical protein